MKIEMYFPTQHKVACGEAVKKVVEAFGGATVVEGQGLWIDPKDGQLYDEHVKVVSVYVQDGNVSAKDVVERIMLRYKREAKQEAVLYAVDGQSVFI